MNNQRKRGMLFFALTVCFISLVAIRGSFTTGSAEAAAIKGTVTADSLNVRTGPSYLENQVMVNNRAVYLVKGNVVKILGEQNNYYKVKFTYNQKTVTGYSNKAYISLSGTVASTPAPTATAAPVKNTVTLSEDVVPNAAVTVANKTVTGLELKAKVTATSLRVRSKASITAPQVVVNGMTIGLTKNQSVTILKQKIVKGVVWYYARFKYQGTTVKGFLHSDYVSLNFSDTVKGKIYTKSPVAVRNTAGVNEDYLVVGTSNVALSNGKAVTVKKEAMANGKKWFRVTFKYKGKNRKGYVLTNQVLFKPVEQDVTVEDTTEEESKETEAPEVTTAPAVTATPEAPAATVAPAARIGIVSTGPLNVREAAGMDKNILMAGEKKVTLSQGQTVSILDSEANGAWYRVSFDVNGTTMTGYVMSQYVTISSAG